MRIEIAAATVAMLLLLAAAPARAAPATFGEAGRQALAALVRLYYAGDGRWRECDRAACRKANRDWGADSATYTLHLRWRAAHDRRVVPLIAALVAASPRYPAPCTGLPCPSWSDVPAWDGVAAMREYQIGHDPQALAHAEAAYRFVERSKVFALGACPRIDFQMPGGIGNHLKTLETGANLVKAALLLYRATHERGYLETAVARYAAARTYFLDPRVPLYTAYVFDDGVRCRQLPRRLFASVNGDMIWNGIQLAHLTGQRRYAAQAIATARAVDRYLSDPRGIFADLQAENDVVEPLVEAMFDLASSEHQRFARAWILRNAGAAVSARAADGAFGRFFDGPQPRGAVSLWQSNGGVALEVAAAALDPAGAVSPADAWRGAVLAPLRTKALPVTIVFRGSGIALTGTLGARCCEAGHARLYVDGVETFNRSGIWQNKSMTGSVPQTLLFAWRWPVAGRHTIRIEPGTPNAKEGEAFISLDGYLTE
ncbi:MAG: hypothetical protein KGM44_13920 [bacterium]|nr:hypothetical protein [bacterium]